jgi:hypothetical protein
MYRMLIILLSLVWLAGCAQPQIEQPKANGAYLVIEGRQAWAVLVTDGKRVEEAGTVLDVIKLPSQHAMVAASYVIETPNCGRLQWLAERVEGSGGRLSLYHSQALEDAGCVLAEGQERLWTALDYSS